MNYEKNARAFMENEGMTPYEIESTLRRVRELEGIHESEPTEENRRFVSERGFKVIEDNPPETTDRPYLVVGNNAPLQVVKGIYGASTTTVGLINLSSNLQSPESLAGILEEFVTTDLKNGLDNQFALPCPPGQEILIYMPDKEWEPVVDLLIKKYAPTKED